MGLDVVRAGEKLPIDGTDAPCDQIGVLKMANSYRAIISFCDEIDEAITVAGLDLKMGMAPAHFRQDGSEVDRAEGKRHCDAQAAAQFSGGQNCFLCCLDLGVDSGCMVSESDAGLRKGSPAGRSCKQLNAKLRFKPEEPTTDDRFGDAQPCRGGRDPPGVGDFDERPYLFNIQFSVPHSATQRAAT